MITPLKNKLKDIYYHMYPRESDGFIKLVKKHFNAEYIKTIFDVGSRDGDQSLELAEAFPNAQIFAFECNPDTLKYCYEKEKLNSRITVIPKAVNKINGKCSFYKNNIELFNKHKDIPRSYRNGREDVFIAGGSSLYSGPESPGSIKRDKIEVDAIRLDTFCDEHGIDSVDLIWMDLEGAELMALESLGDRIKNTKMIWTEASTSAGSSGQQSFFDIKTYLEPFAFDYLHKTRVDGNVNDDQGHTDVPFINTRLKER